MTTLKKKKNQEVKKKKKKKAREFLLLYFLREPHLSFLSTLFFLLFIYLFFTITGFVSKIKTNLYSLFVNTFFFLFFGKRNLCSFINKFISPQYYTNEFRVHCIHSFKLVPLITISSSWILQHWMYLLLSFYYLFPVYFTRAYHDHYYYYYYYYYYYWINIQRTSVLHLHGVYNHIRQDVVFFVECWYYSVSFSFMTSISLFLLSVPSTCSLTIISL